MMRIVLEIVSRFRQVIIVITHRSCGRKKDNHIALYPEHTTMNIISFKYSNNALHVIIGVCIVWYATVTPLHRLSPNMAHYFSCTHRKNIYLMFFIQQILWCHLGKYIASFVQKSEHLTWRIYRGVRSNTPKSFDASVTAKDLILISLSSEFWS